MTRVYENGRIINVEYDDYGNIKRLGNIELKYNLQNKISEYKKDNDVYKYEYNYQGIRTKKTKDQEYEVIYYLDNDRIIGEDKKDLTTNQIIHKLRYYYDVNGICGINYIIEDEDHYFNVIKDSIGNITKLMYRGKVIGEYIYNAWGEVEIKIYEDTNPSSIDRYVIENNPFRYKGYYYDKETKLYYCNARYYNPDIYEWLTPDDIGYLDSESINGLNLYAYCNNDPINNNDPTGHFTLPNWAKWVIGGVAFVGAVALTYLTGGALAPVFIGMVGSILLDGVVEGAISSANGGSFWEGFADGAANGAMWGGIFALGGATLRTIKMFKSGVAIGENMKRVNNLAKAGHQITYKGMPGFKFVKMFGGDDLARTLSMRHNQAFIERMMKWGVKIVDFGIDTSRNYRSFYYLMETIVSNGYGLLQLMY